MRGLRLLPVSIRDTQRGQQAGEAPPRLQLAVLEGAHGRQPSALTANQQGVCVCWPQWSEHKKASYVKHAVREYNIHRELSHPR